MRGLLVVLCVLILAAPAAAKPDPVKKLTAQVAALTIQVKALRTQAALDRQLTICYQAQSLDTFRVVFGALNQFAKYLTGSTSPAWDAYLAQPQFDDKGACAAVGIARP